MNRKRIVAKLFEITQGFYVKHFKKHKTPWPLNRQDLLKYPKGSLGLALGEFLTQNGFEMIPRVERHDAYHVLLNFGTQAQDEIALQYLCFANGKRSKYLFGVISIGTLFLPEYLPYYRQCYKLGKRLNCFHDLDYLPLLTTDLAELRAAISTPSQQEQIQQLAQQYH